MWSRSRPCARFRRVFRQFLRASRRFGSSSFLHASWEARELARSPTIAADARVSGSRRARSTTKARSVASSRPSPKTRGVKRKLSRSGVRGGEGKDRPDGRLSRRFETSRVGQGERSRERSRAGVVWLGGGKDAFKKKEEEEMRCLLHGGGRGGRCLDAAWRGDGWPGNETCPRWHGRWTER